MYIVFEGTVGTGKSTQARRLAEFLKSRGKDVLLTREPGGSEIADSVRKLVQGTKFSEHMEPVCEAYLYAASRAQTLRKVVMPALDKGFIVIADRSYITSMAYQGFARGLTFERILEINDPAVVIRPDAVLYMSLPPKTGLERTHDQAGDKFEREDVAFFDKVQEGYRQLSLRKDLCGAWINIDATGSKDQVFSRIYKELSGILRL
ncbi:MAG: dTMP kinase [Nanoarchaeota archaeon]|nr:dTMP kinase [Nanoarchaeota archaeon]